MVDKAPRPDGSDALFFKRVEYIVENDSRIKYFFGSLLRVLTLHICIDS